MGYQLGVDLGTTYTGAAVRRDGVSEIVTLGTRSATMPTVVVATPDGELLVGEAAERRALELPERTARQFKRRLGDTTPILLGGTPYSPQALLAAVLTDVVARVTEEQGGPPERVCITHPANWGPYKRELVRQVAELAGLSVDQVVTLTEPAAAALHYASQAHLEPGSTVAVYDLGGGTFDAAVVRVDVGGAEVLGDPTGIEHLGGIDFDAVVFDHVARELGPRVAPILDGDAEDQPALWRLREECSRAKEALSSDSDAVVGVALRDGLAEVRITRSEFESMLRPALAPTALSMRRAIESAGIVVDDLAGVLLVGGSSRIPLVSEIVSGELGRPVLLDAHPKHAVALGAAAHAAGAEVGEVVEVVGGEVPLDGGSSRPRWLAPLVAAVVVLLAAVGVLIGLVAGGDDDPDELSTENIDDENPTSTTEGDDDGEGDATTTSTTASTVPGETTSTIIQVNEDGTRVVLPVNGNGEVVGPPITTTTTAAVVATTAPTIAPTTATTAPAVVFTTPSAVRNAVVSNPIVTSRFPNQDETPETVQVTLSWQAPADVGGGLSGYRIVGTPLLSGTSTFGTPINEVVSAAVTTRSYELTLGATSGEGLQAGGYVRWEITPINGAGTSGPATRPPFIVPNLVGQKYFEQYRITWALGGTVGNINTGTCGVPLVCSQNPQGGTTRSNGGQVTYTFDE